MQNLHIRSKLAEDIHKAQHRVEDYEEMLSTLQEVAPDSVENNIPMVQVPLAIVRFEINQMKEQVTFLLNLQKEFYPEDYEESPANN